MKKLTANQDAVRFVHYAARYAILIFRIAPHEPT